MYALWLLGITVAVFLLQLVVPGFTEAFWLNPSTVFSQPWTVFTSMFLHGGPTHLLFNMFALLIFGPVLESRIGQNRFLGLYIASGILGSVGYIVTAVAGRWFFGEALGLTRLSGILVICLGVFLITRSG